MTSATITIPDEIKSELKKFSWVNWSEVAREELIKESKRIKLLEELEELTNDSTLTDEEIEKLGDLVKENFLKKK
jgi:predicted CopG family antitoxin